MPPKTTKTSSKKSSAARSQRQVAKDIPKEAPATVRQTRKRKSTNVESPSSGSATVDLTSDEPPRRTKKPKVQASKKKSDSVPAEKRARKYRDKPPISYLERLHRILHQRMFVVGYHVGGNEEASEISFDVVGSTGNLYKTIVGKVPTCDCPDGCRGNQCKHICYVLLNALKAPIHLQYQLAFLSSELREMYQGSPLSRVKTTNTKEKDGKRKPIEGDCPICFTEFEPTDLVVWCKAACGNNIHRQCFEQWAATTRSTGVRCVYCRTPWEYDVPEVDIDSIRSTGNLNKDGYVNLAEQFGLSGKRDYSMYSRFSTARPSSSFGR